MSANGISRLEFKRQRQLAKLALAGTNRTASGRRDTLDITQLPTVYAENNNDTNAVIDNPNTGGLVIGRPWIEFTPAVLFANDEVGVWYDPSDSSTVFQDEGATIPAEVGDPVGCILDKSGNGFHARQSVSISRPTLATEGGFYYLDFDGIDDFLITNEITYNNTNAQIFAGIQKQGTTGSHVVLSTGPTDRNYIQLYAPAGFFSPIPSYMARFNGSNLDGASPRVSSVAFNSPHTGVITGLGQRDRPLLPDLASLRVNKQTVDSTTTTQGTGIYRPAQLVVGTLRTNFYFDGRIYSLILRTAAEPDQTTIENIEDWVNSKTGAF